MDPHRTATAVDGAEGFFFDFERPQIDFVRPPGQRSAGRPVHLLALLPLHDLGERDWLIEHWASFGKCCGRGVLSQPTEEIQQYFGSAAGLYFEWTQQYTRQLLWPAAVGAMLFGLQAAEGESRGKLGVLLVGYAIFLAILATVFVQGWKRREQELQFEWGTGRRGRRSHSARSRRSVLYREPPRNGTF